MIFYIVRHGDPDYENDTITPFGHREAEALAKWFDRIKLDRIYTSPLGRAIATASYTVKRQGVEPVVLPWAEESMDYMRPFTPDTHCEYRFSTSDGITEYVDFHSLDRLPTIERLMTSSDELFASLGYEREGAHYRITKPNDERVALFCHGGFGTALTAHLLGLPPTLGFPSMFMTTTSVNVFEFADKDSGFIRPRMLHFGETAHLAGIDDQRL